MTLEPGDTVRVTRNVFAPSDAQHFVGRTATVIDGRINCLVNPECDAALVEMDGREIVFCLDEIVKEDV